jgi:hypothetical protein
MNNNIKHIIILALMLVGNITAWANETLTFTFTNDNDYNSYLVYNNTDFKLNPDDTKWFTTATTTAGGVTITITCSSDKLLVGYYEDTKHFCLIPPSTTGTATFQFQHSSKYITNVKIYDDIKPTSEAVNNANSCTMSATFSRVYKIDVTLSDTKPRLNIANANVAHHIADSYDYTGSAIRPAITSVTYNTGTITPGTLTLTEDTDYTVSYTNNTNAGTATVILTGQGDYTGTWSKTFAINKVASTATAPTVSTLTYDGTAQNLCTGGSATGGTMMYSINSGSSWSADVPTATNAGTYDVYYRVIGDQNHTDIAPALAGTATINARERTFGTVTVTDGYANKANNTIVIADGTDDVTIAEDVPNIGSITLQRTFTPGKAATVMLPFDIEVSKVSGGTFYGFIGVDKNGTTGWEVVMREVNRVSGTLQAHTPYLFMPSATQMTFNLGGQAVTVKANDKQTYTVQP